MKHLYNDWDAVVGRAKGLWAPRWRTGSVGAIVAAQAETATKAATTGGDTKSDTALVGGAAEVLTAADYDERPPLKEGESARGSAPCGGSGGDEWGGRGSPTEVVVEKEDASGGAAAGATTNAVAGAGARNGQEAKVAEAGGEAKGRWHRGAWSSVDVRSVQSRLSRIVDDTSARIRSNIVKVCETRGNYFCLSLLFSCTSLPSGDVVRVLKPNNFCMRWG